MKSIGAIAVFAALVSAVVAGKLTKRNTFSALSPHAAILLTSSQNIAGLRAIAKREGTQDPTQATEEAGIDFGSLGKCTEEETEALVTNECKALIENANSSTGSSVICEDTCIDTYRAIAKECYEGDEEADVIILTLQSYCGQHEGKFCIELLDVASSGQLGINFGQCAAFFTEAVCTQSCIDSLSLISTALGCCFNNLFNNSALQSAKNNTDQTSLPVASETLWSTCDVTSPDFCLVDLGLRDNEPSSSTTETSSTKESTMGTTSPALQPRALAIFYSFAAISTAVASILI